MVFFCRGRRQRAEEVPLGELDVDPTDSEEPVANVAGAGEFVIPHMLRLGGCGPRATLNLGEAHFEARQNLLSRCRC